MLLVRNVLILSSQSGKHSLRHRSLDVSLFGVEDSYSPAVFEFRCLLKSVLRGDYDGYLVRIHYLGF